MRSRLIAMVVGGMALLILLPSSAAANKSWPVYRTDHFRAGSVRAETPPYSSDNLWATVWENSTMVRYCGELMPVEGEGTVVTGIWKLIRGDGSGLVGGLVVKASRDRYIVYLRDAAPAYNTVLGRVTRELSGPWRLAKRVNRGYRNAGVVPRSCPGALAAGGARLLGLFGMRGLQ